MSHSNWRSDSSVAGWVAFFVLLAFLCAEGVAIFPKVKTEPNYCKAATQEQNTNGLDQAGPSAKNGLPPEPKERAGRESDKCVQWRSTIAAEAQATYTKLGFWLLVLTLGFTAWAAVSARRAAIATHELAGANKLSADAAIRSARAAEHALSALERPYLAIERVDGDRLVNGYDGYKPAIDYTVMNYGKTSAILRTLNVRVECNPGLPLRLPAWSAMPFYSVVEPGKRLPVPGSADNSVRVEVEGSREGQTFPGNYAKSIVVYGSLHYQGMSGAYYSDRFCFRAGHNAEVFHPDGGDEYNYCKTLADPAQQRSDDTDP